MSIKIHYADKVYNWIEKKRKKRIVVIQNHLWYPKINLLQNIWLDPKTKIIKSTSKSSPVAPRKQFLCWENLNLSPFLRVSFHQLKAIQEFYHEVYFLTNHQFNMIELRLYLRGCSMSNCHPWATLFESDSTKYPFADAMHNLRLFQLSNDYDTPSALVLLLF